MFWTYKALWLLNWLLKTGFEEVDRGKKGIPSEEHVQKDKERQEKVQDIFKKN